MKLLDSAGVVAVNRIANKPPKYLPQGLHALWSEVVLESGHKNYAGAVCHFRSKLALIASSESYADLVGLNGITHKYLRDLVLRMGGKL